MGDDEIIRLLNAKIKLELKQYKKRILRLEPEEIYRRAYQIDCKENIAKLLQEKAAEMERSVICCLLVLPNTLQFFYSRWLENEDSFQEELETSLDNIIEEIRDILQREKVEAADSAASCYKLSTENCA